MTVSNSNTRIIVTLPKDIKKILQEKADEENRSLGNYIATILKKHIGH